MICFNKKASAIETANAAGFDLRLDQAESSKKKQAKENKGETSFWKTKRLSSSQFKSQEASGVTGRKPKLLQTQLRKYQPV